MFRERMVTPAIPERVFALCKIVEKKPIFNTELKEKMEPEYLHQTSSYYSEYRTAAEEVKLITISDNMIYLAVDPSVIKTTATMRKYINGLLSEFQSGQFYQVTKVYFELGSSVLKGEKSLVELAPMMRERLGRPVDAMAMRAWRFWVSYLGFGHLQDMFFIPNAAEFLKDIISVAGIEKGRRYSFGDFMAQIGPYIKIIVDVEASNHQLNYGVSNGLRTLHDAGIIKLEHILDQEDIWNLYPLKAHEISGIVTNITLCR